MYIIGEFPGEGNPVFDPGYDTVVGDIPGKGAIAFKFTAYFFELLKKSGIPTHYIATAGDSVMIVEPADPLGLPAGGPEFEGSAPLQNLEAAGVMTREEIEYVDKLVKDIAEVVCRDFAARGLYIVDGKFELGRLKHGDGKRTIKGRKQLDAAALEKAVLD